jgi:hypothetical protein
MFEATVIPLTTLPTAHSSPEAVRTRAAVARRPWPPASGRSAREAGQLTAMAAAPRTRR